MKTLLIECGVAETRGALLDGGDVQAFFFAPARGDEHLPRPAKAGDIYFGRVRSIVKSIGGAFVDIGEAQDGFIPFTNKSSQPNEGASLITLVRRPALGGKGAVLSLDWQKDLKADEVQAVEARAANAKLGDCLNPCVDAALEIAKCGVNAGVEIDSAEAAKTLKQTMLGDEINIGQDLFEHRTAEEALEAALQRDVLLPGGGRLIFDQTEGPCVIDIDAGDAVGATSTSINDKINSAAASHLHTALSQRAIGGRIIVDFLPPSSAAARKGLQTATKGIAQKFGGRAGNLSKDGLFDMTLPRTKQSLLERATEPVGEDWPAPGRRLTLDWTAKEAIRKLERTLARMPSSRPRLIVSSALKSYLDDHGSWTARLIAKYSARFSIDEDKTLESRTYDLVE